MRIAGVVTAVTIALVATAAGVAPLLVRHARASPRAATVVYAFPVSGGPPTRLSTEPSRAAMGAPAGLRVRLAGGLLTVRTAQGRLVWTRAVGRHVRGLRIAPDGLSALLSLPAGIELVTPTSERYVARSHAIEPAYSPDGRTVYVLGANAATSIPK